MDATPVRNELHRAASTRVYSVVLSAVDTTTADPNSWARIPEINIAIHIALTEDL
jgi:hypothetical protein